MYSQLIHFIRQWYQTEEMVPLHEPRFGKQDRQYVMDAIDSTFVSSIGEYVKRFEDELADYLGAGYAIATMNGTAALQVALHLAGVGLNDEVITQPLSFVATANAIVYNNATPVFVDVDKKTLGLCPKALESFLDQNAEKKTAGIFNKNTGCRIAAIVPMHTFGHPVHMGKILEIAECWGIPVVEDAAEALGSKIASKHCGTFGISGILSFNGNKTITCGGGGAIVTNNATLAKRAKHITTTSKISHPWEFAHDEVGYNFRMPNLNAALACAQLARVDKILKDKRALSLAYINFFSTAGWGNFITEPEGCISNYWLNAVVTDDRKHRDALLKHTNESGVMTRPIWQLLSDLPMFTGCPRGTLENARWLCDRVVNLPSSARAHVC